MTGIALLGDSYVAAMEVSPGQRFGEILEGELDRRCGGERRIDVMNFAVVGYGTAQQMESLRHHGVVRAPAHVFHFFYTGNDLYNNYRPIDVEPNRLHYDIDSSGDLVTLPFTISDNPLKRWLRHHSRAFLFIRDRLKRVGAVHRALTAAGLMQKVADESVSREAVHRLSDSQYLRDPPPEIRKAWRVTSALLAETRAIARNAGAQYHLVTIPARREIEVLRGEAEHREAAVWDELAPHQEIARTCREYDLDCLNLLEGFSRAERPAAHYFFPRGGHWTPDGHALVARLLLPWLIERVCPSPVSAHSVRLSNVLELGSRAEQVSTLGRWEVVRWARRRSWSSEEGRRVRR